MGSPPLTKDLPVEILWLNDAPLFIDERQVEAFYDAILQPDFEEISRNFSESISAETTIGGSVTLGAALPWLVKSEAGASASRKKGKGEDRGSNWNRVVNPHRHLLALVLQYATQEDLRTRLVFAGDGRCVDGFGNDAEFGAESYSQRSPRAMTMLDLQPGTPFIPLALELTNGKVMRLYEELSKRLQKPGKASLPEYPHKPGPGAIAERKAYWEWFVEFYDKRIALEVVEDAVQESSIAWIDYRFPLDGRFPHLHFAARGNYATGVFAYQLVSRGNEHGLRIVGTLKTDPGVNVLAAFDR